MDKHTAAKLAADLVSDTITSLRDDEHLRKVTVHIKQNGLVIDAAATATVTRHVFSAASVRLPSLDN